MEIGPDALAAIDPVLPKLEAIMICDCSQCKDAEGLLYAAKEAFYFPWYFGMNWNALHECMNDFEFLPFDRIAVMFAGIRSIESRDAEASQLLIEICNYGKRGGMGYRDVDILFVFCAK